jgi:hypothetical protein
LLYCVCDNWCLVCCICDQLCLVLCLCPIGVWCVVFVTNWCFYVKYCVVRAETL